MQVDVENVRLDEARQQQCNEDKVIPLFFHPSRFV